MDKKNVCSGLMETKMSTNFYYCFSLREKNKLPGIGKGNNNIERIRGEGHCEKGYGDQEHTYSA